MPPSPIAKSVFISLSSFLNASGHALSRRQYPSPDSNPHDGAPFRMINSSYYNRNFPDAAWACIIVGFIIIIVFFCTCYAYGKQSQWQAHHASRNSILQKSLQDSVSLEVLDPPPAHTVAGAPLAMEQAHFSTSKSHKEPLIRRVND
jgi:hypothetical protein